MATKKLKAFDKFHSENKHRLYMPRGVNYPINYKKGLIWANSHCDLESREFAEAILRHTEYVSFESFLTLLDKICTRTADVLAKERKKNKRVVVVLILPTVLHKSNTWVSLLAYESLSSVIDDIYFSVTDAFNSTRDHRSPHYEKHMRCILCDDCAYTGQQISDFASLEPSRIKYKRKPTEPDRSDKKWLDWSDSVSADATMYINNINPTVFSVYAVVPYMSTVAQDKLQRVPYVVVPKDRYVFPVFSQITNMNKLPSHITNEFRQTFQYHKEISAIYFDHKIADAVSTFNKVYLLAPLFNCAQSGMRMGFIEGCPSRVMSSTIEPHKYYLNMESAMGDAACPVTFYKKIPYTYKKKKLNWLAGIEAVFG
jgi:hypothetical protein